MMHLVVMPDARQGLRIMKFTFKHPYFFRSFTEEIDNNSNDDTTTAAAINEDNNENQGAEEESKEIDDKNGITTRIFCGFLLGFFQFIIPMLASFAIILLLFNESKIIGVMIKFVAFSSVTKFDDFYAANMTENPIKGCVGKKINFLF